jgi:hypothetical protein
MALESFLVVLKENVSPQATDRVVSIIKNIGGRVEIIIGQGKVIIATFDNSFTDGIRKLSYVKLVGGATIRKRKIMRKQIIKQQF